MSRVPGFPYLFNFVIDEVTEDCLNNASELGVDLITGSKLTYAANLTYANNEVRLFDEFSSAQLVLDCIHQ